MSAAIAAPARVPAFVAWIALLACETLCQVSLKFAGNATGAFEFSAAGASAALGSPWLWIAVLCYVGGFLCWMAILRRSSLSGAFPASAIVFVAVLAASYVVFGEPLGWEKLLGSAIIVGGILLLGSDDDASSTEPAHADNGRTE